VPHTTLKAIAVAACLSFAGAAEAATIFKTTLAGTNENPPNASLGTGQATLTLNGDTLNVAASFSGLTGTVTAAHIHCCALAPANVGVATQVPTFLGFPSGVTSGTYNHDFDLLDLATYNPAFVTANGGTAASARDALLAGLGAEQAYFNVHTTVAPGGEIRGQFALVPEPATWALFITGFGLAGLALRRRAALLA